MKIVDFIIEIMSSTDIFLTIFGKMLRARAVSPVFEELSRCLKKVKSSTF
jgi:hypothetical protein